MTGVVYDDNFITHKCLWDENYSENPQRYISVLDRCNSLGLINRCIKISSRQATKEELLSKHTVEHIDLLESTEHYNDEKLEKFSSRYDSIYVHNSTYRQSLLAAGSSIELVKAVVDGRIQNGMAFVRPPGHHAMESEYSGYCFINNVAIATQYLLDKTAIQKILIVDWDIHHGQATQQMFYEDPRVLYFSIHRYEHGQFWPNLRESDFDHVGNGSGTGFNVNVPLNDTGMKNEDYMAIIHYLLIPLATEFSPDLIIVSSGYDSAIGDPKGEMLVTPACYAHITQKLMSLSCGRVVAILEGGYYLKSLAESAALTLRALLGDPCPVIGSLKQPCKSVMETIGNVIYAHRHYWDCFKYNIFYKENLPKIQYNFFDEKPEIYQTRNMYPKIDTTDFDIILNNIITETKLFNPKIKVGLISKVIEHSNNNFKNSDIYQYLKSKIRNLHVLKERQLTIEEFNIVYSSEYIKEILNKQKSIDEKKCTIKIINNEYIEDNPMFNTFSFSAGPLLQIIDSIFENEIKSGIFVSSISNLNKNEVSCTLNASIIGANYAIKKYFLKRILIIELNENVTQIYSNDQILVISMHSLLNNSKAINENNHINISWSKVKILNEAEFTTIVQHLILPIAYEYNPELIIVSSTFYSNINNYINGIQMTPIMCGYLIQWLSTLANGRLILYEQDAHDNSIHRNKCLLQCSKALLGEPISQLSVANMLNFESKDILFNNIKIHRNNWKSLQL
ncbi:histone deacetylase 6 isoform X1 [Acyrthosiphon pisum]|uniref:Histone deacetylase domain-containing protein n=1 Tax=Acyrthosiphon pisum TaxID=7029 RepID=A0A8R2NNG4_ACYPI|nr:histone deacetylase 6 isoform X1 [Acyrthosiphon pisum]XP_016661953.1 histone deacetylase 6 isoform X1 [Acyrthosiphon pisum]XP_029344277.1 histone deacetylase 6 isoform X1 [Acyrthosiphon pisum]XP_029344278.1 histone deacetylase 6 isoform X1 [Acyrthosiphon pisum]|eukprot:XP_008185547.1 PREDICTED: histone deacetylase 6 isoform X1 [Acyrthosiphon pisum]